MYGIGVSLRPSFETLTTLDKLHVDSCKYTFEECLFTHAISASIISWTSPSLVPVHVVFLIWLQYLTVNNELSINNAFIVYCWSQTSIKGLLVTYSRTLLHVVATFGRRKQFGPRAGPTERRPWSESKSFDTLEVFLKYHQFFWKA